MGTLVGKVGLGVVVTNGGLKFLKFELVFCYIVTDFFSKKKSCLNVVVGVVVTNGGLYVTKLSMNIWSCRPCLT